MTIGIRLILFLCSPFFLIGQIVAQSSVVYGSNDGSYIQINDANIYYEEYGDGTPTMLLHGGLGSISNFKEVIPELSMHFRLLAIDSPGHGRSRNIDSLSYQVLAEHIAGLVIKLDLDKVNIIGYSDGAIVGMLAASKIPNRVNKLVFGAGALGPKSSKPEGLEMLRSISPEMLPKEFATAYKEKSPNPEKWEDFVNASKKMWLDEPWISRELLQTVDCKVLVLFGDRDQFIPLNHATEIHGKLSNSELCILPNLGHEIFNSPELVNPILIQFLSEN